MTAGHFEVQSNAGSPSPAEIAAHLERAWARFRDLFGLDPAPVRVVLRTRAAGEAAAQPDQEATARAAAGGTNAHVIAWTLAEGEDLEGQGMSDLAHEIAHLWFLDLMGRPEGLHQPHAWLHEAVACWHETASFREARERWIRERSHERFPLAELFAMRNPVKEQPLVDLTVQLHGKLARGEIDVGEMNRRISEWASQHAHEIVTAGVRNMTWYAQSLSVFEYLVGALGVSGARELARELRAGAHMPHFLVQHFGPRGLAAFEERWVSWLHADGDSPVARPTPGGTAS